MEKDFLKKPDYSDSESQTHDIPTHSNKRSHSCQYCGKSFTRSYNLNKHQRVVHPNARPHSCQYLNCGKSFQRKDGLREHQIATHSNDLLFCQYCGKGFKEKYSLNIHHKIHSNVRPYSCQYLDCDASFRSNYKLELHQTLHSNERLYSCQYCGGLFKRKNSLHEHKKKSCKAQGKRKHPGTYNETDNKKRKLQGPVYCVCQSLEDGGDMIGCDEEKCEYKWFHFRCVRLQTPPASNKWYCPKCRESVEGEVQDGRANLASSLT